MTDTVQPEVLDKDARKLKKEIELSKRVQKQRLDEIKERTKNRGSASSRVKMARHFESPRETWVRKNIPESIEKRGDRKNPSKITEPATVQVMFDAPAKHKQHVANGWEPIIEDGEHYQDRLDLGYTMPMEIYRDRKLENAEAARLVANEQGDAMEADDTTRGYGK